MKISGSPVYHAGMRKLAVLYVVSNPISVSLGFGNPSAASHRCEAEDAADTTIAID
jgi:hypothetical protein